MPHLVLDKTDMAILEILRRDARTPYTDVAREIGVSDATIHVRVKKLEEAGVIKKYTVVVDHEKVGKPLTAFILVNVRDGKIEDVASRLTQIEDIREVHEIHGRYDALLRVKGENIPALRDILIQKIRKEPSVTETEILTVFKTWKDT